MPLSAFTQAMTGMITQARQQLLQLPASVAPSLEGEIRATIKYKLTFAVHQCYILLLARCTHL